MFNANRKVSKIFPNLSGYSQALNKTLYFVLPNVIYTFNSLFSLLDIHCIHYFHFVKNENFTERGGGSLQSHRIQEFKGSNANAFQIILNNLYQKIRKALKDSL